MKRIKADQLLLGDKLKMVDPKREVDYLKTYVVTNIDKEGVELTGYDKKGDSEHSSYDTINGLIEAEGLGMLKIYRVLE